MGNKFIGMKRNIAEAPKTQNMDQASTRGDERAQYKRWSDDKGP